MPRHVPGSTGTCATRHRCRCIIALKFVVATQTSDLLPVLGLARARPAATVEKIMNSAVLAASIASIALLVSAPAFSQGAFGSLSIDSCPDYVARATSQVQMATGCSFPGPRWSVEPADHLAWCKGASPRDRGREDDERRKALGTCRGDFGAVPIKNCNEYVVRSRTQLELAESLGSACVFEGMRWSSNLVQHMNWCNRTPVNRHEFEDAARRKELAACTASPK